MRHCISSAVCVPACSTCCTCNPLAAPFLERSQPNSCVNQILPWAPNACLHTLCCAPRPAPVPPTWLPAGGPARCAAPHCRAAAASRRCRRCGSRCTRCARRPRSRRAWSAACRRGCGAARTAGARTTHCARCRCRCGESPARGEAEQERTGQEEEDERVWMDRQEACAVSAGPVQEGAGRAGKEMARAWRCTTVPRTGA